jgi:KAP family P-loop domain/TIR domain
MPATGSTFSGGDRAPNASPPEVFISRSHADAEWSESIVRVLRSRGIEVWDDSQLRMKDSWAEQTEHAIDNARVAVLLISPGYLSSEIIRGREVPYLLARRVPLFPVLVEYCDWQLVEWLSGIRMFPGDGRPLSAVDAVELESYLASAALEIGTLAGVASAAEIASAKVSATGGGFAGMATLVSQNAAIGILSDGTKEQTLNLEFPGMDVTVSGVVREFPASDAVSFAGNPRLTLLNLITPVDWQVPISTIVPGPGSLWECWSFHSATGAGVFTTGTVLGVATRNGREYLHLRPSVETAEARGMSGAAIVVDGNVVGILESQGAILDEWFAISLQSLTSSAIWAAAFSANTPLASESASPEPPFDAPFATSVPTTSATATPIPAPAAAEPEFDPANFVTLLTPEAVTALLRAEGYRVALGQARLHMEHLLLGLYGQVDSPIRRLARDARIYDERSFQRGLSKVNGRLTGDLTPAPQVPPITLPALSSHVREAFVAAQKLGGRWIGRSSLLNGALTVDCSALSSLRSSALPQQRAKGPIGQRDWIIGVSSDVPGGRAEDLLDLQRDVNALCSVIAAADAALPLSIGLFAEWGSGKSFFMNMMEQRLDDLQKVGPPAFCSKIIQLKFNAWHYMDTSLWASLTSEIFEGLATKLSTSPGPEPANRAAKLLEDLSTSRDKLAEAERQRETAKIKLAESEVRLQELAGSEAKIRASLSPRVLFAEATRLAFEQEEVKDGFKRAAKELNLPQAVDAGAEVNKELLELRGIFSAMFVAMRNTERLWIWVLALVLVVLAVFGIPLLAHAYLRVQWNYLNATLTAAATFLAGAAAFLGPFFVPAKRALRYLQEARKKSDELVRKKKVEKCKELNAEYDKRKEEVEKQEKAVDQEREMLEVLQEAVEQLRADRQMLDFIKRRNASSDYTTHLGVVARAHKDFKELSALLARVAQEPAQTDLPRVDRIVLYIDDLDRCPEDKVMDVLQAVHLLLAFPLFVVVVGVDPRWLLHSVASRSTAVRRDIGEANGFEQSTPLDYLEKIFQIPFTLSPMSAVGFGSLVDKVAGSDQGDQEKGHSPTDLTSAPGTAPKVVVDKPQAERQAAVTPASGSTPAHTAASGPASPAQTREEFKNAAVPLKIESWERDYMKKLYCLIPSPRAGKRFINIYRMIRSTVDGEHWQAFVGDEKQGGDHRQALLLLAILTGYPGEAAEILRQLIERVHNETWWEFIDTLNATDGNWSELRVKLQSLRSLVADTDGCDVFRHYASWVARYSFQSGRVLLALQLPDTDT